MSVSSSNATFETTAAPDTTPPVITNVTVLYLSPTIAVVEWTTDKPTTGIITYGSATQSSLVNSTVALYHQEQISDLPVGTAVPFTIYATDTSGNGPTTATGTMQTTDTANTTPPVISDVVITPGSTTLDISWDTNEAATSVVSYQVGSGVAISGLTLSRSDSTFAESHNILLTSLAQCQAYSIAISSVDPSNNFAQTGVYTGTTICPCVNTLYAPASDSFGAVYFEDNWPAAGDLDFNDQVVAYRFEYVLDDNGNTSEMQVHFAVPAIGASYKNGVYLHLPIPASAAATITREFGIPDGNGGYNPSGTVETLTALPQTDLAIQVIDDTRKLYPGVGGFINTDPTQPTHVGQEIALTITFTSPIPPPGSDQQGPTLDTGAAPYDLYISRTTEVGHEIHLSQFPGSPAMDTSLFKTGVDASNIAGGGPYFITKDGLAFALNVPMDNAIKGGLGWVYMKEKVSIDHGFPGITPWASSGGGSNASWWNPDVDNAFTYSTGSDGLTPQAPVAFEPDPAGSNVCGEVRSEPVKIIDAPIRKTEF